MPIRLPPRNYLTAPELLARWQCDENDLRYAIISEELKPSIRVDGELSTPEWKTHWAHGVTAVEPSGEGYNYTSEPRGWHYLQCPQQIAAFDCKFQLISDDRNAGKPPTAEDIPFTIWYWLPKPVTLADVMKEAVFLLTEVAAYEAKYGDDEPKQKPAKALGTLERETLLKLVVGMAMDGYGFDPKAAKSPIPKQVADALGGLQLEITDDTVRKYLKQAVETVLPR